MMTINKNYNVLICHHDLPKCHDKQMETRVYIPTYVIEALTLVFYPYTVIIPSNNSFNIWTTLTKFQ